MFEEVNVFLSVLSSKTGLENLLTDSSLSKIVPIVRTRSPSLHLPTSLPQFFFPINGNGRGVAFLHSAHVTILVIV